jgi:hypothetical protein
MKRVFVGGLTPEGTLFESEYHGIREALSERFEIVETIDEVSSHDFYLAIDSNRRELKKVIRLGIPFSRRGAIAFEPAAVAPWQTEKFLEKNFKFYIRVGQPNSRNGEFWPQKLNIINKTSSAREGIAMFGSNKLSFSPTELYSLRRALARSGQRISVFGSDWSLSIVQRLLRYSRALIFFWYHTGEFPTIGNFDYLKTNIDAEWTPDKDDAMRKFQYCLVLENSMNYSSEKLLDAIRVLTVPIYVGPNSCLPIEILDLCVLAQPNIRSINEAIIKAELLDLSEWRQRVELVLSSSELREKISENSVMRRIEHNIFRWIDK